MQRVALSSAIGSASRRTLPLSQVASAFCRSRKFRGERLASSQARSAAVGFDFKTTISAGKISALIEADMPEDGGGKNEHPSPKDLVMAGLAACTSMTLQTRAAAMLKAGKLQEGDLTRVVVEAKDDTAAGTHMPKKVEVSVELEGSLSDAQRRQLMASVKACPVKRMLQGDLEDGVEVKLVPSSASK